MSAEAVQASRVRACPVCGNIDERDVVAESTVDPSRLTDLSFASRKTPEFMHHRYVRCPDCGLVYASPAPDPDAVLEAYGRADFDAGDESALAARTYVRLLDRVLERVDPHGALIDIGAGDGAFLAAADGRGFSARVGFEPSAAPIASAAPDVRPLLRQEPFSAGVLPPQSASVVTCLQTIEHVDAPLALCEAAAEMLHPRGALILVCHDVRSLSARVLGTRSPIFDVEHLQLFSRQSARALLRRAGFATIEVRPLVNVYPLSYWLRLAPMPAKERVLPVIERTRIGRSRIPLRAGNLAVVAFRA